MLKTRLLSAVFVALPIMAAGAHAATYTVDFAGDTMPTETLAFLNAGGSGVDISVTSRGFKGGTGQLYNNPFNVGQYSAGIGVCTGTVTGSGDYCDVDNFQVDGQNKNEMVLFAFSKDVTITSVAFDLVDDNDDFSFSTYAPAQDYYKKVDIPDGGNYEFDQTWIGSSFGIGARQNSDQFTIRSLTFEVAPVPLPASAALLLAGVAGLGAMRRRKKS